MYSRHTNHHLPKSGERESKTSYRKRMLFGTVVAIAGILLFGSNANCFLSIESVEAIDDWSQRSYWGNGNGQLDPGEIDELVVTLSNTQTVDVLGVTATLSVDRSPFDIECLTVVDAQARFGDIPASTQVSSTDHFLVEVNPACPSGYNVSFILTLFESSSTYTSFRSFNVVISPPRISGSESRLDRDRPGSAGSSLPQISSDENGHVYVAWQDHRQASPGIYFNYSADYGVSWHDVDMQLGSGVFDPFCQPRQIASDKVGHVYVVWEDRRAGRAGVYFNHSSDFGQSWQSQPVRLNSKNAPDVFSISPEISCDNAGRVYVVWNDTAAIGGITFNYSSDFGNTWQDQTITLNTVPSPGTSLCPAISSDEEGHVYVVWEDNRQNNFHIYFNHSSDFGVSWQSSDKRLDRNSTAFSSRPQISSDEQGHVYVVWDDGRRYLIDYDIYLNYSSDFGLSWQQDDIRLDRASVFAQSLLPRISSDEQGHVYVVWHDNRNASENIYFNYSNDYGLNWQVDDVRLGGGRVYSPPQISSNVQGHVYVTWSKVTWNELPREILLNFSTNYGRTWRPQEIKLDQDIDDSDDESHEPRISSDTHGHVYVVWGDNRNGNGDIYFREFTVGDIILAVKSEQDMNGDGVIDERDLETHPGAELTLSVIAKSSAGGELDLSFNSLRLTPEMQDALSTAHWTTSYNRERNETIGHFRWTPGFNAPIGSYDPIVFIAKDATGKYQHVAVALTLHPPALPALVSIVNDLGRSPDTFISPKADDVRVDSFNFEASEPIEVLGEFEKDVSDLGDNKYRFNSNSVFLVGQWAKVTLNVRSIATSLEAAFTMWIGRLPNDINQDGQVNLADATRYGSEWNGLRRPELVDLDGDGQVTTADPAAFVNQWHGRPPAGQAWNGKGLPPKNA